MIAGSPLQRYIVCDSNLWNWSWKGKMANWIKLFIWPWNWRIFVYFWCCESLKIHVHVYVYGTHFEIVFFLLFCMKLSTHSHGQLCGTRKHQFSSFELILILPLPLPDIDLFAHCVHTNCSSLYNANIRDVFYRFSKPTLRGLRKKQKLRTTASQPATSGSAQANQKRFIRPYFVCHKLSK